MSIYFHFQVAKTQIWHSSSLRRENDGSSLSSIILDVSKESLPKKPTKDGRFVYRFVRHGSPRYDLEMQNGDALDDAPPLLSNLDHTLRCGDYVVWDLAFFCLSFAVFPSKYLFNSMYVDIQNPCSTQFNSCTEKGLN